MKKKYNYQTYTNLQRLLNIILLRLYLLFSNYKNYDLNLIKECSLVYEYELPLEKYLYIKFKSRAKIISFSQAKKKNYLNFTFFIKNIFSEKIILNIKDFNLKNFKYYSNFVPEYFFINRNLGNYSLTNFRENQIYII